MHYFSFEHASLKEAFDETAAAAASADHLREINLTSDACKLRCFDMRLSARVYNAVDILLCVHSFLVLCKLTRNLMEYVALIRATNLQGRGRPAEVKRWRVSFCQSCYQWFKSDIVFFCHGAEFFIVLGSRF